MEMVAANIPVMMLIMGLFVDVTPSTSCMWMAKPAWVSIQWREVVFLLVTNAGVVWCCCVCMINAPRNSMARKCKGIQTEKPANSCVSWLGSGNLCFPM